MKNYILIKVLNLAWFIIQLLKELACVDLSSFKFKTILFQRFLKMLNDIIFFKSKHVLIELWIDMLNQLGYHLILYKT